MTVASGTTTLSNAIYGDLVLDLALDLPALPDMSGPDYALPDAATDIAWGALPKIQNADLTTETLNGTGVFDILMRASKAHLKEELSKGRIVGDQYTKAYIAMTSQAMQTGAQFLMGRDQAYWQTALVRAQTQRAAVETVTAKVGLETAKSTLSQARAQANVENKLSSAQYALAKLNLAVADEEYQLKDVQRQSAVYNLDNILPAQKTLVVEQGEAQRAQTMDTRSDGAQVTGSIGKQKELYSQQIDSYIKDSQYKVAKLYSDSWQTQKTLDEGLVPPNEFTNATVETVLSKLRTGVNLT